MDDIVKISRATWNYLQKQNELLDDRVDCLEELANAYWHALREIIKRLNRCTTGDDLSALLLITSENKLVPLPFSLRVENAPTRWKFGFDKYLSESERIAMIRKIMARQEYKKRRAEFLALKEKKAQEKQERENRTRLGLG